MKGSTSRNQNKVIRITTRLRNGSRGQGGFTLIELLVVIIIIAVLATIAVPTFMGQRQKAQDAAAYTLVRNALTALQGAFVDTGDYEQITLADLEAIEPSIHWVMSDADLVSIDSAADSAWISDTVGAAAVANQVAFFGQDHSVADLASVSASGNTFGIQVNTVSLNETGYAKVKVIDGEPGIGW